jgi:hypothetical protein
VVIASRGERAIITGDAAHHPVQWAEPSWKMTADSDFERGEETRRRLVARCADKSDLIIGTHYAAPTAGHILGTPDGFVFKAYEPRQKAERSHRRPSPAPRRHPTRSPTGG